LPGSACEASLPTYRVEAPRASDAIGGALRDAFVNDNAMPDEMAALLSQLERSDWSRAN
jgi:hypothetical protein